MSRVRRSNRSVRRSPPRPGCGPCVPAPPPPSVRASSRTSIAWPLSGTRCSRRLFMRVAGTVQTPYVRSISSPRGQPHLAAVRTMNSNTSATTGSASDARTVSIAPCRLAMRQGLQVLRDGILGAKYRAEPVARIVGPVFHRHSPFQRRPDPPTQVARQGRLDVPDRSEDLQHVGTRHIRDRHLADARKGIAPQARHPLIGWPRIPPAGPLLFHHGRGSLGEARHASGEAFLGERVAALAGHLPVRQRLLPGLGERDQGDAAQSGPESPPPGRR